MKEVYHLVMAIRETGKRREKVKKKRERTVEIAFGSCLLGFVCYLQVAA